MTAFCLNDGSGRIKLDNFLVVKKSYDTGLKLHMFAVSSAFAPDIHAHTQKQKGGYRRRENRGVKRATDRMPTLPKHHFVQMKLMFGDTEPVLDCGLCNFSALHHEIFSSRPLNVNVWSTSFGLEWPDWPFKKNRHSFVHFFTQSDAFVAAQNWNAHTTPQRPDARGNAGEYTNITIYLHDHVLNTHVSTRCHYRVSCSTRKSTNRRPNTTLPWKKGSSHALWSQNC